MAWGRKKKETEETPVVRDIPKIRETRETMQEEPEKEIKPEVRLVTSEQLLFAQLNSMAERQEAFYKYLEIINKKIDLLTDIAKSE